MKSRLLKLLVLLAAAAGGVAAWQRKNETPATPPTPLPSDPFMRPVGGTGGAAAGLGASASVGASTTAPAEPAEAAPVDAPPAAADVASSEQATARPSSSVRPGDVVEDTAVENAAVEPAAEGDHAVEGGPAAEAVTAEQPVVEAGVDGGPAADAGVVAEGRPSLPQPPRGPFATAPNGPGDDLTRISGVGPKLAQLLNEQGITTFAQIAALDDDGVDALQSRLPQFPGRIRRDAWVSQAQQLDEA